MNLYVIRHGQTDWNKQCLVQGKTDVPLNNDGINNALLVKNKLNNINFDICYSSPLKRATQTANIVNGTNSLEILDELIERNYGLFEGENIPHFDLTKEHWDYHLNYNENGLESLKDLLYRSDLIRHKILSSSQKNVLIVSHAAILKALHYSLIGYDENTNFLDYKLDNCEIVHYKIEKGQVTNWQKL